MGLLLPLLTHLWYDSGMVTALGFSIWFLAAGYTIGKSKGKHYEYAFTGFMLGIALFFAIYLLI